MRQFRSCKEFKEEGSRRRVQGGRPLATSRFGGANLSPNQWRFAFRIHRRLNHGSMLPQSSLNSSNSLNSLNS